jgi:hypothetical protein
MLFNQLSNDTRECACGGTMHRVEELSQTIGDQCDAAEDTLVCNTCGQFMPVDIDPVVIDYEQDIINASKHLRFLQRHELQCHERRV